MRTGTEILNTVLGKTGSARESILVSVILSHETPDFMNKFVPVHVHGKDNHGDDVVIEILVSPDYVSVGTNQDFVRVPLFPGSAQLVADQAMCILPTKRMVDLIYQAASIKVSPATYAPQPGGFSREDTRAYLKTNAAIQKELGSRTYQGLLIGGQKKDIVLTNQLLKHKGNVAIYGWHQKNGKPIQGLNAVDHSKSYVDYSHGVRLISRTCRVNGVEKDLLGVIQSDQYGSILTGDDPLKFVRYSP